MESQGAWTGNFGSGSTTGQWNVNSGSTGSIGTGPDIAHSGKERFYCKSSKDIKYAAELGIEVGENLKKQSKGSYKK